MLHQRKKNLAFTVSYYITKILSPIYRIKYSSNSGYNLHLGASYNLIDGFINIDGNPLRKGNLYLDIRNRLPFKENSIKIVYACNIFEHFYPDEIIKIAKDIYRVLIKGGIIRIVVPDLEKAIAAYNEGNSKFFSDFPRKYSSLGGRFSNFILCDAQHKIVYDFSYLAEILTEVGFDISKIIKTSFGNSSMNDGIYNKIKPFEEQFSKTGLFVEAIK